MDAEAVSSMDAIAALMAEQAKYETFLRELDYGDAAKPAHVVAKVRADYTAKLTDAVDRLRASRELLTSHAAALATKLQKLEESERQIVDEHAEAEVRKQVGELSESDWELSSKKAESHLMHIKQEQQLTAADINRIREIISGVSATDLLAKPVAVDELAFLKSVVGAGLEQDPTAQPAAPPASVMKPTAPRPVAPPPPPPPPPPATPPPPPPARESLIEVEPMLLQDAPPGTSPPTAARKPVARPAPDDAPPGANVPEGGIQLKSQGATAQAKTLKCAECGTLNTLSEWYCERCGAELTQL